MKNYEIVDTNVSHFRNIKLSYDFADVFTGDWIDLFGTKVQITQKGDSVVALANKTQIFVFQELAETNG